MLEKIHTENAPEAIGPYTQAIICNGMLYTSGQIAINPETNSVEETEIEGQTQQVIKNLKAILKEANTSIEHVIKTTCFLSDMSLFGKFNEIYGEHFVGKPARSCVAAKALPKNVLVEIEVIAKI